MIRSVKTLRKTTVDATDGRIGVVTQVFFDDERWTIRYLIVRTDKEFDERRVLISPMAVSGRSEGDPGAIRVRLTRRQVAVSPDIDSDKPVSRQKELEYNRYYLLPSYWDGTNLWGAWTAPSQLISQAVEKPPTGTPSADIHLRSSREVIGYEVKAVDSWLGSVKDFLYDDSTWRIRFIETSTRRWVGGRRVLVPPAWIHAISWAERTISLDLPRRMVRGAPAYDSPKTLTPEFLDRMRAYYSREVE